MDPVVSFDNVSFFYGGLPVLHGVSMAVERGDFAAILGANGAGKSTLLKLILGELHPKEGSVRLLGQDVARFHDWPRIGYVPQYGVTMAEGFPATAQELVRSSLYSQIRRFFPAGRVQREKAKRALETVGMGDQAGQLIGTLSGGQLQRVMVARVLVTEPELMLLDEPTAGVDARSAAALYELLDRLRRERGITIAMVTHDTAQASAYANRVFCLEEGSLLELAPGQLAHELAHRHKHPPHSG